jgi:HlyD family secretion protein
MRGGRLASKKARIAIGVAMALVLAAVVGANVIRERGKRVGVQTQKVARKDLVSVVSASGEVRPKRYVNVSANVSGRITLLLVKEGDTVRKGQVLARIDSTRFEAGTRQSAAAVEAAKADLARAQADLEAARLAFERNKSMHADKLISDSAFDQAQADMKMKEANVQSQRERIAQQAAALETNRDDLAKTTVVSPMDGVVTALQKEEGEMVIGAQSFSPTVIMTVADLSVMETEVMVDETDIRNLTLGQEAEVRVDALEGVKIKGQVTEIGSSAIVRSTGAATQSTTASTANQAKDFKVTVTLVAPPAALRPGLNATADIRTASRKNVLAVPIQAVVVREVNKEGKVVDPDALQAAGPQADEPVRAKGDEKDGVFVVEKDKAVFKPVKTGIVGETEVEVLSGLADGEQIVSGSYRTLRTLKDQAKIKPETKKEQRT